MLSLLLLLIPFSEFIFVFLDSKQLLLNGRIMTSPAMCYLTTRGNTAQEQSWKGRDSTRIWKRFPSSSCCCGICVISRLVVSNSLRPYWLQPTRVLCPWDSPGKNTGMGCHSLLPGSFPTQGSNLHLQDRKWILYPLSHLGAIFNLH